jgi:hypothetical protein
MNFVTDCFVQDHVVVISVTTQRELLNELIKQMFINTPLNKSNLATGGAKARSTSHSFASSRSSATTAHSGWA